MEECGECACVTGPLFSRQMRGDREEEEGRKRRGGGGRKEGEEGERREEERKRRGREEEEEEHPTEPSVAHNEEEIPAHHGCGGPEADPRLPSVERSAESPPAQVSRRRSRPDGEMERWKHLEAVKRRSKPPDVWFRRVHVGPSSGFPPDLPVAAETLLQLQEVEVNLQTNLRKGEKLNSLPEHLPGSAPPGESLWAASTSWT